MRSKNYIPNIRKEEIGFYAIACILSKYQDINIVHLRRILQTTSRKLKSKIGEQNYEKIKRQIYHDKGII